MEKLKIAADPRQAGASGSQAGTAHETTRQVSEGGWSLGHPLWQAMWEAGERQTDRHTM